MKYLTEKMKLAFERGAEVECKRKKGHEWKEVDAAHKWDAETFDYRLVNSERDGHLSQFDLHPFDVTKLKEGDICIDENYREFTFVERDKRSVVMKRGTLYFFFSKSGYRCKSTSIVQLFIK